MIQGNFAPIDGDRTRFRRSVTFPGEDPAIEDLTLGPDLYPRWGDPLPLYRREEADLAAIGQRLFRLALGEDAAARVRRLRSAAQAEIRIQEDPKLPEVNGIPWELMHDGEQYLALDPRTPIRRIPVGWEPPAEVEVHRPLRILVFWAAPTDAGRLAVEDEQIRLALALAPFKQQGRILDFKLLHCTRDKLKAALQARDYDLIYFTGHGAFTDGRGYLVLEDEAGGRDLLPASELARWLGLAPHRPPALIVLNCCLSAAAGEAAIPGRFLDLGRRILEAGEIHVRF